MAQKIVSTWGGCLLIALFLAGCHSVPRAGDSDHAQSIVVNDKTLEDALATIDGLTLQVVSGGIEGPLDAALPTLGESRVVFVGETHTQYEHHLVQLALLRALHQQDPRLAVGVEWFQQDLQRPLDDYMAGRIGEAEMLQKTEYYERWRYDYRLYRPIVEYAKRHQLPLIALNAPADITRKISSGGLSSLAPEVRARLPSQMDGSDPTYRQRVRAAYDLHPGSEQPFENFLSVQLVWDESMAENAAKFLRANPQHRMIVLAGTGHAGFRTGIPDRLLRRLPVSTVTVMTVNEKPGSTPEAGSADVLVVSPSLSLPPSGKLGVLVNTRDQRVTVSGVLQESGAYRAGIRKSDQILKLEGQDVQSYSDLKLALMDKRPGDTVVVVVQAQTSPPRQLDVVLH